MSPPSDDAIVMGSRVAETIQGRFSSNSIEFVVPEDDSSLDLGIRLTSAAPVGEASCPATCPGAWYRWRTHITNRDTSRLVTHSHLRSHLAISSRHADTLCTNQAISLHGITPNQCCSHDTSRRPGCSIFISLVSIPQRPRSGSRAPRSRLAGDRSDRPADLLQNLYV
jgi:hypothetical protein